MHSELLWETNMANRVTSAPSVTGVEGDRGTLVITAYGPGNKFWWLLAISCGCHHSAEQVQADLRSHRWTKHVDSATKRIVYTSLSWTRVDADRLYREATLAIHANPPESTTS
jgi:hypothetical protein